jgi:hypothetical protein
MSKEQPIHIEKADELVRKYVNATLNDERRELGEDAPLLLFEGESLVAEEIDEAITECFENK